MSIVLYIVNDYNWFLTQVLSGSGGFMHSVCGRAGNRCRMSADCSERIYSRASSVRVLFPERVLVNHAVVGLLQV